MSKYTDLPEVYVRTGLSNTWDQVKHTSHSFCTKYELLYPGVGVPDYQSNVSGEESYWASSVGSKVKVSNNSTVCSVNEYLEASLCDYASARDMLYHWEKQDKGRLASAYAVYFVEKNFSLMNLEVINSLLLCATPKRLTPWSMVALLRASYSAKHLLPAWAVFYALVKDELKNNDRAPKLLAGLDQ